MAWLKLRMPAGGGRQAHWQSISLNGAGPAPADTGILRMRQPDGTWHEHVDPGADNARPVYLHNWFWEPALYMGPARGTLIQTINYADVGFAPAMHIMRETDRLTPSSEWFYAISKYSSFPWVCGSTGGYVGERGRTVGYHTIDLGRVRSLYTPDDSWDGYSGVEITMSGTYMNVLNDWPGDDPITQLSQLSPYSFYLSDLSYLPVYNPDLGIDISVAKNVQDNFQVQSFAADLWPDGRLTGPLGTDPSLTPNPSGFLIDRWDGLDATLDPNPGGAPFMTGTFTVSKYVPRSQLDAFGGHYDFALWSDEVPQVGSGTFTSWGISAAVNLIMISLFD